MAIEEFGTCTADRVGITVDTVMEELHKWGEDGIRDFLNWYRNLSEADRALFNVLLSLGGGAIIGILGKALGAVGKEIAAGLVVFLGFAAWGMIIGSMIECSDKL